MNYSYIFSAALPRQERFKEFGFLPLESSCDLFFCRKALPDSAFYVEFSLDLKKLSLEASVFDSETCEKYALFDVPGAQGAFVGKIRSQVQALVDEFKSLCFDSKDLRSDYVDFICKKFSCQAEFPWNPELSSDSGKSKGFKTDAFADYAVFRCKNNKWFALIMKITYKQLYSTIKDDEDAVKALSSEMAEEKICCVNLKASPEEIESIVDKKSVFPAYHMNKKHWITVVLTSVTDFKNLCALTEKSYNLVCKSHKKFA